MVENIQNYEYCEKTAIHGMVFDPTETYLYSADMWANRVWCHKKIDNAGRVETVGYTDAPAPKDHPRWVEMHPSGNYLYALMEGGNRLCEYVIDPQTRLPIYTHKVYPLIPPGKRTKPPALELHADYSPQAYPTRTRCTDQTSVSSPSPGNISSQPHDQTPSLLQATSRLSRSRHQAQSSDRFVSTQHQHQVDTRMRSRRVHGAMSGWPSQMTRRVESRSTDGRMSFSPGLRGWKLEKRGSA